MDASQTPRYNETVNKPDQELQSAKSILNQLVETVSRIRAPPALSGTSDVLRQASLKTRWSMERDQVARLSGKLKDPHSSILARLSLLNM